MAFLTRNLLIIALLIAACLAFVLPEQAALMNLSWVKEILIFYIFICQGLKSDFGKLKEISLFIKPVLIAIICSQLIAPVLAFTLIQSLNWTGDLAMGVMLMSCMGSTIASGIIISEQAKADRELAILLTIILSLLSVFIIPINLSWTLSSTHSTDSQLFIQLLIKLSLYILLPVLVGQGIKKWLESDRLKKAKSFLKVSPILSLATLVFISIGSNTAMILTVSSLSVFSLLSLSLTIHYGTMFIALLMCKGLKISFHKSKAVAILSSQKTLPVAITIWVTQFSEFNLVLSIAIFHLSQILGDSLLSKKWAKETQEEVL